LARTTLIYKMDKLGIERRRSQRARSMPQFADQECHAAANCSEDAGSPAHAA
jgi:hypothetical protein